MAEEITSLWLFKSSGTLKTKGSRTGLVRVRVPLFCKSHCVICVPAYFMPYHVTGYLSLILNLHYSPNQRARLQGKIPHIMKHILLLLLSITKILCTRNVTYTRKIRRSGQLTKTIYCSRKSFFVWFTEQSKNNVYKLYIGRSTPEKLLCPQFSSEALLSNMTKLIRRCSRRSNTQPRSQEGRLFLVDERGPWERGCQMHRVRTFPAKTVKTKWRLVSNSKFFALKPNAS